MFESTEIKKEKFIFTIYLDFKVVESCLYVNCFSRVFFKYSDLEGIKNFRNVSWFELIFRYILKVPKVFEKIGFGILHK